MIGQTISHYKILEKLGEGGMGVVYKAQDTKLDRLVGLKFLPEHVSAGSGELERFVQEAKAAAALNHPSICTIYGIEEADGKNFIAMEFVDGQTLQEKKASLSQKQALEIGIQIAEGLAAAHEKSIVHRDIKPENIMIRKDGRAQIMDFGLAKLKGASRLTKEGSTVGTAGYMSPEQLQGQETDHRTDIFSLGVILYELLTGQSPFKGIHETAISYEIVNVDPEPISAIKPEIDPQLDAIVLDCLEKDQKERCQSAAEVARNLRRVKRESSRTRVSRVSAARPISKPELSTEQPIPREGLARFLQVKIIWPTVASVLLLGVAAVAFLYYKEVSKEPHPIRFAILPPEKAAFASLVHAISPDGTRLVFVGRDSTGKTFLWARPMQALEAQPLAGTENASYPFWSPESRFIGFFAEGKLKKIEASGGPARTVADAPNGRGGTWNNDGVIVFAPNNIGGIYEVSAAGGATKQLTMLDTTRQEDTHRWPFFLPDGRHFIYVARSTQAAVVVASLDSKEQRIVMNAESNAIFASPGYLLFIRESSLMAQPFDAGSQELRGDAIPVEEDVGLDVTLTIGAFSASQNGVLTIVAGVSLNRHLVWHDRSGKQLEQVGTLGTFGDFALSPDEKRVVYRKLDLQTKNHDLWILDLSRRSSTRLTFHTALDDDPIWSPDGSKIVFDSNRETVADLYQKISSGAGNEELLLKTSGAKASQDWSKDGRFILFQQTDPKTKTDLWVLPMSGDRKPIPYLQTEFNEATGVFSPDGRWVAYMSNESGKNEIYVQSFPVSGGKWQISTNSGAQPRWRRDGKELFYIAADKKLMVAEVKAGSTFEASVPKALFEIRLDNYGFVNRYAVAANGQRFLINEAVREASTKPITVVVNWTAELKKK